MASATGNTPTGRKVWAAWNELHQHDPSPVKRIARQLNLSTAEVAAIVYPADKFGTWDDDQEEDVTADTWEPTPEWIATEAQKNARLVRNAIALLSQEQNPYYTFGDMVSDLREAREYLNNLVDLADITEEMWQ